MAAVAPVWAPLNAAMAASHGASDATNRAAFAAKYAAWAGSRPDRSDARRSATAGMVLGWYQRWGLGVSSGSPSRCCTLMTWRDGLGVAASTLSMNSSYPRPFWMTIWAAEISFATTGLTS